MHAVANRTRDARSDLIRFASADEFTTEARRGNNRDCQLVIAKYKLLIEEGAARLTFANLQFAILDLQFAIFA
ncbi:MAG: hypothetical protein C0483_18855 [Pirellula sp.]|nr:hypothetical protein [Pirellula sp.]